MAIVCRYLGKICPNDRQGSCQTSPQKCKGCHWKRGQNTAGLPSAQSLCMDCVFWCGMCVESSLQGRRAINRIASSEACEKFTL